MGEDTGQDERAELLQQPAHHLVHLAPGTHPCRRVFLDAVDIGRDPLQEPMHVLHVGVLAVDRQGLLHPGQAFGPAQVGHDLIHRNPGLAHEDRPVGQRGLGRTGLVGGFHGAIECGLLTFARTTQLGVCRPFVGQGLVRFPLRFTRRLASRLNVGGRRGVLAVLRGLGLSTGQALFRSLHLLFSDPLPGQLGVTVFAGLGQLCFETTGLPLGLNDLQTRHAVLPYLVDRRLRVFDPALRVPQATLGGLAGLACRLQFRLGPCRVLLGRLDLGRGRGLGHRVPRFGLGITQVPLRLGQFLLGRVAGLAGLAQFVVHGHDVPGQPGQVFVRFLVRRDGVTVLAQLLVVLADQLALVRRHVARLAQGLRRERLGPGHGLVHQPLALLRAQVGPTLQPARVGQRTAQL